MSENDASAAAEDNATQAPAGVIDVSDARSVLIPAHFPLFKAEFVRAGPDLLLLAPEGETVVLRGFFAAEEPPDLIEAGGGQISGALASELAGPLAPGQLAQAAGGVETPAVGQVDSLEGSASATRADGTVVELQVGEPVFKGDVIATGTASALGIIFVDESVLSLGDDSRIVVDEMVYDPAGHGAGSLAMIEGVFVYVSGAIARTDPNAMVISTPVASIGIRGTAVGVSFDADTGTGQFSLLPETDPVTGAQFIGEIVLLHDAAAQAVNVPGALIVVRGDAVSIETVTSSTTSEIFQSALTSTLSGSSLDRSYVAPPSGDRSDAGSDAEAAEAREMTTAAGDAAAPAEAAEQAELPPPGPLTSGPRTPATVSAPEPVAPVASARPVAPARPPTDDQAVIAAAGQPFASRDSALETRGLILPEEQGPQDETVGDEESDAVEPVSEDSGEDDTAGEPASEDSGEDDTADASPDNRAPDAVDDSLTIEAGETLRVDLASPENRLLENDGDPEGDPLEVVEINGIPIPDPSSLRIELVGGEDAEPKTVTVPGTATGLEGTEPNGTELDGTVGDSIALPDVSGTYVFTFLDAEAGFNNSVTLPCGETFDRDTESGAQTSVTVDGLSEALNLGFDIDSRGETVVELPSQNVWTHVLGEATSIAGVELPTGSLLVGLEDLPIGTGDMDFNDLLLAVTLVKDFSGTGDDSASIILDGDGIVTVELAAPEAVFDYTVSDGQDGFDTAQVTVIGAAAGPDADAATDPELEFAALAVDRNGSEGYQVAQADTPTAAAASAEA